MKKIGFIGCGNMAKPIIRSIKEKNVFDKSNIYVYDINREMLEEFCKKTEINAAESEKEICLGCDVVVLCTKPQVFSSLLPEIAEYIREKNPLVVSIAAGKDTGSIAALLGFDARVARIFPNLNAEVGEAVSAYTGNVLVGEDEISLVSRICQSYGEARHLPEELFSVFGVLGGCVPAYAFMFIGALAKAGEANGLDSAAAREVAVQAVLGSARLLKECGGDTDEWIAKVCSPGGTTIQGINSLRESDLEGVIATAFGKSLARDRELLGK